MIRDRFPEWYSMLATYRLKQCPTSSTYDKNRIYSNETVVELNESEDASDEAGTNEVFTFTQNTHQKDPTTENAHRDVKNVDTDRIENTRIESRSNDADRSESTNEENSYLPKGGNKSNRGTSITSEIIPDCSKQQTQKPTVDIKSQNQVG
ncbi:hypothetical protein DPMN_043153 [Dreissena polymorpha]|uniref:Uncharacterized protein n=1 Tax=Dreissena polymorpha TaxID=45954 RepID=A0A9D4HXN4_DREPO|nr:hypothetical protein DPMN_043153 [Dreissena polymorpha]